MSHTVRSGGGRDLIRWLALLLVGLLFTVGCDSSEDFVNTGTNNNNPAQTGAVTFNFVRAQAALQAPQNTVRLRFQFFSGTNGTGTVLQTELRDFASSITINPVTAASQSVVVTALDPGGVPTLLATVDITIVPGGAIVVDFDDGTIVAITLVSLNVSPDTAEIDVDDTQQFSATATYSNDDTLPAVGVSWTSSSPAVATIDATSGLATGKSNGNVTITASVGSVSDTATLKVSKQFVPVLTTLTVTPDGETVGIGGLKQFLVAGLDQNGNPFTLAPGSVTWTATSKVSINATSGVAVGVAAGSATVTATVGTVSDSATVGVFEPALDGIVSATPNPVFLVINGEPGDNTTATLVVVGSFGTAPNRTLTNPQDTLNFLVTGSSGVANVTSAGVVTPIAVGQTTIMVSAGAFNTTVSVSVSNDDPNPPLNQNPVVTLDSSELVIDQNSNVNLFPTATVTDDQPNLAGGTLTIGPNTDFVSDVDLFGPASPTIGSFINGDNTLVVTLNSSATPANIQTFLRGVVGNSVPGPGGDELGEGVFEVTLSDGLTPPGQGNATRNFVVIGDNGVAFTVDKSQPNISPNFHSINIAILSVTGTQSLITVVADDYTGEGTITIGNNPLWAGLRLRGPNSRASAGVLPDPRGPEAQVQRIDVDNSDVVILGFQFLDGNNRVALQLMGSADNFLVGNCDFLGSLDSFAINNDDGGITPTNVAIYNNTFRFWQAGVRLDGSLGGKFEGIGIGYNDFTSNVRGVDLLYPADSSSINNNGFNDQILNHIIIQNDAAGFISATGNAFHGRGSVRAFVAGTVNAILNYWSGYDGADLPIEQGGTPETGLVNFFPFMDHDDHDPFPAYPGP